jgi:hypothetical protein
MRWNRVVTSIFYLLLGGGFVVAGILHPYLQFIIYLGAVLVLFGVYTLSQLPKRPNQAMQRTAGRSHA